MLTSEELERLEEVTGLDWRGIGFNRDEWVKNVIDRLFGGNSGGSPGTPSTPSTQPRDEPKTLEEAGAQGGASGASGSVEGGEPSAAPSTDDGRAMEDYGR
jgi:hypothetical protein